MENYIKQNKEAWEEAFELRDEAWGANIEARIGGGEPYAFFNRDTAEALSRLELKGKSIGHFCCNNGRELLSLVSTAGAREGVGFDIAENMVEFANSKAAALALPCKFVAANILEIGEEYAERFDLALITIGALCWFRDVGAFFAKVARCVKPDGVILINEQHPAANMLSDPDEEVYDEAHPLNCIYSYFDYEWINNAGMQYITGKAYDSKTFTDYTHPLSEIVSAMCASGFVITGMREFDYDISDGFPHVSGRGFPLSVIIEGRKLK